MRLVLAVAGLLIIYVDPSEPSRYVAATYASLVCYVIYSGVMYMLARRRGGLVVLLRDWSHWVDVAWYALLVALTGGTNSIFFFGFVFAIMSASFRGGIASGLAVTVVSAGLFAVIGLETTPDGQRLELNRLLLRPAYLLVLGYMMAYWGGFEIELRRRLALLKEVSGYSNPRLGVDRTIDSILERLSAFFGADSCLLVRQDAGATEYRLHRLDRRGAECAAEAIPLTEAMARLLLALPDELAVVYNGDAGRWRRRRTYVAFDVVTGKHGADWRAACETLASAFDADAVISVPMRYVHKTVGRLYVTARGRRFGASSVMFLLHVVEHVAPVIDNIRLVDRLASTAADQERRRIARSIHDSVIQPYIGLQMGLSAVRLKLSAGRGDVARDIDRLNEMTDAGIASLRAYVEGLRDGTAWEGDVVAAVRRFAATFSEASGIEVLVESADDVGVGDRLAAEVFQMIAEGLSNVRRHTLAGRAVVRLTRENGTVTVEIENEGRAGQGPAHFVPRSIAERAEALGGETDIVHRGDGATVVRVEIPL